MMDYNVHPQNEELKLFREPHSRYKVPYRTIKEMQKLYPDGDFTIIGEIGGIERPPKVGDRLLISNCKFIPILPRGSFRKPFEWVCGYVAVDKNIYLATIRSPITIFYWLLKL